VNAVESQPRILECAPEERLYQAAPAEEIRVAVHATDPVVRAGLLGCLRQDRRLAEIDTAAGTGEADVVVVAVTTADGSTLRILRSLRAERDVPFLVIVKRQWKIEASAAVECGVRAVLWHSDFSPEEFAMRVLVVAQAGGSSPHTPEGDRTGPDKKPQLEVAAPIDPTPSDISEREADVLRLIAEGLELAEIAEELSYSERTIKYVLHGVMKRWGLRNRAHAVSYAIRTGLI
jgi:DNA-binding NarL/FixJ family response regulator